MGFLAQTTFAVYALIILGGAILAIVSHSLVRALLGLIFTLFGVAGLYLLMNAPFMAFMQILIYVGAVAVLIFFALMLTRAEGAAPTARQCVFGFAAGLIPAGILSFMIIGHPLPTISVPENLPVLDLGRGLMNQYFLAFELISVVLMVAMSGAVLLTWERREKK